MNPICLIPARAGSKGLPNKNMLFLDGKPMIFHTIDAAIASGCFRLEDIYVSTDSELYRDICATRGIQAILRPEELSMDTSTSYDFTEHFLREFDEDQVFVLLQVTSPLRTGANIREALSLFESSQAENVVSFSKVEKSPAFFAELDENGFARGIEGVDKGYRRQNDTKALYAPNGAIYISRKSSYLEHKSYFTDKTLAYVMKKEDSIDVDDRLDFTSVIGRLYFDYKRREERNKEFYRTGFTKMLAGELTNEWLLGDSRTVGVSLAGYTNLSQGGLTAVTAAECSSLFDQHQVSHIVLALGVNDLITAYTQAEIESNYRQLVDYFLAKGAEVSIVEVAYTLFRDSVDNATIDDLNQFLRDLAAAHQLPFLEINASLSQDGHLRYDYTSDGLHFNALGQECYNDILAAGLLGES